LWSYSPDVHAIGSPNQRSIYDSDHVAIIATFRGAFDGSHHIEIAYCWAYCWAYNNGSIRFAVRDSF
jgi:hypothetical protein